ncbi:MAG: MerR family DNA-binding transcriptional regulator [Bdellovibrio sp.]|nr:MerR family DNA-binding transcriptional regulator [Bdellovibrio sp.]
MLNKDAATLSKVLELSKHMILVGDLAKLFEVHPDTIRRWERSGRIKSYRHPINNYRMFALNDLKGILIDGEEI